MFTCPVCYYTGMQDPPTDYNICVCCGTEFGNDDELCSHADCAPIGLRETRPGFSVRLLSVGMPWTQLHAAHVALIPYDASLSLHGSPIRTTRKTFERTEEVFAMAA